VADSGGARVAASSAWQDEDGVRQPSGDVHGWQPGANQTQCGLALSRTRLRPFPHVSWSDAVWMVEFGTIGEHVTRLCPRCRRMNQDRPHAQRRARAGPRTERSRR
jgi:hypothetical protein